MRKYHLLLVILGFIACKKDEIKTKPLACFYYTSDSIIKIGDTIFFSNCSENTNTYFWDFDDGYTSTIDEPYHSYENAGSYVVKLDAANENSIDTISKSIIVVDQYYTNINIALSIASPNENNLFDLDIDKDGKMDISISVISGFGSYVGKYNSIKISLMNGYEIGISNGIQTTYYVEIQDSFKLDTIIMPKVYVVNENIRINSDYSNNPINIVYNDCGPYWISPLWSCSKCEEWITNDYRYIAFRKISDNNNILAWLKVKITGFTSIYLNSCRYFKNKNEVVISDH